MSKGDFQIVRTLFDSWNKEDREGIFQVIDEKGVFDYSRSNNPDQGIFTGQDEILKWIETWWETLETHFNIEEMIEVDGQVVACISSRNKGRLSGVVVEARAATIFKIENDKIVRATIYQSKEEALTALGERA